MGTAGRPKAQGGPRQSEARSAGARNMRRGRGRAPRERPFGPVNGNRRETEGSGGSASVRGEKRRCPEYAEGKRASAEGTALRACEWEPPGDRRLRGVRVSQRREAPA